MLSMEDIKKLIHSNGCAFELGLDVVSLNFRSYYLFGVLTSLDTHSDFSEDV